MLDLESTNARHVLHSALERKFGTKPYLHMVANNLVTGPTNVYVRRNKSDYGRQSDFEKRLYIRLEYPNVVKSWAQYEDGNIPGCVLRQVKWDKRRDMDMQVLEQQSSPTIQALAVYMATAYCDGLARHFEALDNLLALGISLDRRPQAEDVPWYNIALFRSFDYGHFDLGWNFAARNIECERIIFDICAAIDELLQAYQQGDQDLIEEMKFVYERKFW